MGYDTVLIDDDTSLDIITHLGDIYVTNGSTKIKLQDVVLVPELVKNIPSVSKLINYYAVNCDFSNIDFCIKEWKIGRILIMGQARVTYMSFPLIWKRTSPYVFYLSLRTYGIKDSTTLRIYSQCIKQTMIN